MSTSHPKIVIIRLPEVRRRVGASRSSIYNWINPASSQYKEGFPKPVKIGSSAVGWIEAEIDAWLANLVANARR